ncbi:hypothetical protein ABWH98_24685 [Labrenzia sp. ac12]
MFQLDPPERTSISHAVRWVTTGERCLGYRDSLALNDYPNLDPIQFDRSKLDILLALRHKKLTATGDLEIFDSRSADFDEIGIFAESEGWKYFLSKYKSKIRDSESGRCLIGYSIEIPRYLWDEESIDWNKSCLKCRNGVLQARFSNVYVPTVELFDVFGQRTENSEAPDISETEKKSLLKLIAAMSIEGYGFNPKASKNDSTTKIVSALERLGIELDRKTILKWLREASKEVAAEYEYKNK